MCCMPITGLVSLRYKKITESDLLIELTSQELVVEHNPQKQVSRNELLHEHETPTPTCLLGRILLTQLQKLDMQCQPLISAWREKPPEKNSSSVQTPIMHGHTFLQEVLSKDCGGSHHDLLRLGRSAETVSDSSLKHKCPSLSDFWLERLPTHSLQPHLLFIPSASFGLYQ